jgi:carboxymethylenebutenolidase
MLTRRQMIATTGTFAGYAVAVDKVLAQAIKTDTDGIVAGDQVVKIGSYEMPVYEARPASGKDTPIVLVLSEIWGVHEYIRDCTRRFAKAGYYAVAPELFKREGGVAQIPNVQDILKIVLAQKREQTLGDLKATVDWAKTRPNVKASSVGVTGWCWGGSTVYQEAATNHDIKGCGRVVRPPARPYQGASGPVTGFDLAKDIHCPFLGLYGETDQNPKPEDATKMGELLKQAQQERRDRHLSRRGARLPRGLPAVVQRRRRAGRLEALHGVLREEPARLAPRDRYAAGDTTSARTGPVAPARAPA